LRGIAILFALSTALVGGWHGAALAAQLTLTWTAGSSDEQGFSVERAIGSGGTFTEVARPGAGVASFLDTDLANGTAYCYRLRAFNSAGYSPYSETACGATAQMLGLAVLKVGAGSGTVTSVPGGIACGASCSGSYAPGTAVVLSAAAATGSIFSGWTGAGCSGTGACSVTLNASTTVTATFALQTVGLTVVKAGAGAGTVSSAPGGINCGETCAGTFPINTPVTLTATPSTGSVFAGWSGGGCSGSGGCTVPMSAATAVTATFNASPSSPVPLTVTKSGAGTGIVASAPSGIGCGTTCSSTYPSGTVVTLSASPSAGSAFAGWSGGGCAGTGACTVTLTSATAVTASFAQQSATLNVALAGSGAGTVSSTPAGIACGATCAWTYPLASVVTLTATPASGSSFAGWSGGGCSGTSPCATALTGATTVTATFSASPTSFSDGFERADSTVLGSGWTEPRGDFEIRNRSLRNGTSRTRHLAIQTQLTVTTGTVRAEFTSLNNNAAPAFGLVFGYVDASNHYAAYRQVGGSSLLRIVRVTNGVEIVLAQRSCPNPVRGEDFDLAVSLSGSQIVFTGAGRSLSAAATASAGRVGIMVKGGGASHTVDDFDATRQ
jgi:hypothetical protein